MTGGREVEGLRVETYQIGSCTLMAKGRVRFSLSIGQKAFLSSYLEYHRSSPVSLRFLADLARRRAGA